MLSSTTDIQPRTPDTSEPAERDVLLAQHLELLLRQSTAVFAGNFLVAGVTPFALWNLSHRGWLIAWALAVVAVTMIRVGLVIRYRHVNPPPRGVRPWAWTFAAFSGVSGCLWGATGLLFFDPEQPLSVVYVAVVLSGMVGGSVASLSNFLPAYVMFAVPALSPVMLYSFWIGGPVYTTVGFLASFMLVVNLSYSRSVHRTIGEAIRLRFANLGLIRQLQEEKTRAEAANRAKSVFLAAASHDLRQPSHALGLFVDSLLAQARREGGPTTAGVEKLGVRMRASLRQLHGLLNGVLDVSRLDAGVVHAEKRPVSLDEVFTSSAGNFTTIARGKGLEVRLRPRGLAVESDPVLLARIVSNLVANAIRYTDKGGVLVAARRCGNDVRVDVWDTGRGIPADRLEQIFEEFVQLENPARDQSRGLGLGLAIVRRTARLLGHRIEVRSRPGRGSRFRLTVPLATAEPPRARAAAAGGADARDRRILVVDDEASVVEATADLLLTAGYRPVVARDGEQAVVLASEGDAPALIIADYRLANDRTGTEAIAAVRAAVGSSIPALIITGDTSPERLRELRDSGHPVLHKPIDGAELLGHVRALVDRSG